MREEDGMIGALLKLFLVGFLALVALGVVLGVVGMIFGLAIGIVGLVLKLAPILLVGYVVLKLVERSRRPKGYVGAGDRRWLDR
jgi:hypothetical protein